MALTHVASMLTEVVHTSADTVAYEPGWLYAEKCETWWWGQEHVDPVTVLLVYRSPLVKDTGKMFRPVSKLILGANKFEVIASGTRADENLMGERGEFMVVRMTRADAFPEGPLSVDEVREAIYVAIDEALGMARVNAG